MLRAFRTPLLVLPLACLACQTAPVVKTELLEGASLADYRSFAVAPDLTSGDDPAFGPRARAAAEEALISALLPRGLAHVDDGGADLLLAVGIVSQTTPGQSGQVAMSTGPRVVTTRSGVATPVGNVPLRESHHVVHPEMPAPSLSGPPVTRCHVVLDAFDAETRRHLWRGRSRCARYSPDRVDLDDLRRRVEAIARKLPRD